MEEMLYKFINEGKQEHEGMRAFINEFRTTNELLFKERNNSLSELRFEVHVLLRVIDNAQISNYEVKGVTTRGGKTTTQNIQNDNTNMHTEEPLVVNHDKPDEPKELLVKNQHKKTNELVVQPSIEETARPDGVKSEHLYSASTNEIDEKKPELKILPCHLEYAYLHGDKSFPIIISSKLSKKEKMLPLQVLEKHMGAIAWKMSDIKGINLSFCMHKILMEDDFQPVIHPQRRLNPKVQDVKGGMTVMEDDFKPVIQPQRRLNPKVQDVVRPIHVVSKKGGMTVVLNDDNELIPSRTVTKWQVCIDYCKLNDATQKDHFPLPIIDQMLERLCGNEYYCFLDGFSRFFQILITLEDQEKTTFTCPYATFAYRRISFGLCNAPATFQRRMTTVFHDMVEDFMEVFMDDFLVFGNSFNYCLANLDRMLARCEETNLVPNWKKCHFMVKEDIVLGHKISRAGIEVDWAKIDVIAKLPYPTNVKGDRSFLGHPGFYRRAENLAADHLSILENPDLGAFMEEDIADEFLNEHLMILKAELNDDEPWLRGDKDFKVGDKILLLNFRFKMHPGKLKSKWYGPNVVKIVYLYGTVEITDKNGIRFKVNGQRLKKYYNGHIDMDDKEVIEFEENTT
ncbi:reverse transcriptase domain-containing protein [Tanacetum coccineum]